MSRLSTRRRDRGNASSPMVPRHSLTRRTNSSQDDRDQSDSNEAVNRWELLSIKIYLVVLFILKKTMFTTTCFQ